MNAGSENSETLTPEQELLMEGCKLYLDVMHAINAFQTRVCHVARDVINNKRDQIARIANLEETLKSAYVYVEPKKVPDNNFTGSQARVGAAIWLDKPVEAPLYLGLVFHRDPNNATQAVDICFALEVRTRVLITRYGDIFRGYPDCKVYDNDENGPAVELRRPLGNPLRVQGELETMLDNALTQWDTTTRNGEST